MRKLGRRSHARSTIASNEKQAGALICPALPFDIECNIVNLMKISYLDGPRLSRALTAGSQTLIQNSASLDAINVFPVPDGDTGTNMASTVRAITSSLAAFRPKNAGSVLKRAAQSALAGARGNSGAILAQFFSALAEELQHDARIGAKRLANAAVSAAEKTRRALSIPKEGTILTVLHDWAHAMHEKAQQSDDILHVFIAAYESAKASLARTRNMLPEMKRAGVVDAGAKGFVHMLEGIVQLIRSGSLKEAARADKSLQASTGAMLDFQAPNDVDVLLASSDSQFRYCTEALVHGEGLDLDAIRTQLSQYGDSVVVAGTESLAKIHVHTDAPYQVFDFLDSQGLVDSHKVDDMELQKLLAHRAQLAGQNQRAAATEKPQTCAIVTDTGCDLPEAFLFEHGVIKVPALITIDGKTRPDGPALDIRAMHRLMREHPDFSMSTSQPTDAAFSRAFAIAAGHSNEILYIGLTAALSGTFQAGVRAATSLFRGSAAPAGQTGQDGRTERAGYTEQTGQTERSPQTPPHFVAFDSRTVTAAQGILTSRAVEMAEHGLSAGEIARALETLRDRMVFFVAVRNLSSLIRSGRLHGVKSVILRKFGLRPLLTTNKEGKAETAGIYAGEKNTVSALLSRIKKAFSAGSRAELHISHVDAPEEAQKLADLCAAYLHPESKIVISEMGPVLASLAWLGAISVAGLPESVPKLV